MTSWFNLAAIAPARATGSLWRFGRDACRRGRSGWIDDVEDHRRKCPGHARLGGFSSLGAFAADSAQRLTPMHESLFGTTDHIFDSRSGTIDAYRHDIQGVLDNLRAGQSGERMVCGSSGRGE